MTTNRKPTGRASSMGGGLAAGAAVSLCATLASAGVLAWLLSAEKLAQENTGYGVMILLLASSFLGAMTAAYRIKRRRLIVCTASALIYFGLLMAMTALFFGGQYSGVGVTGIMVLCGGMLAIFPGMKSGKGVKQRKIKIGHR